MQFSNDAKTVQQQQQPSSSSKNHHTNRTSSNNNSISNNTEFLNSNPPLPFTNQQKTCLPSSLLPSSDNNCKPSTNNFQRNVYYLQSSLPCNINQTTNQQNIPFFNNMNNQVLPFSTVGNNNNVFIQNPSSAFYTSNFQPPKSNPSSSQSVQKSDIPKISKLNYSWDGILPLAPISVDEINKDWELFQFHQQKIKEHHLEKERKLSQLLQQISQIYGQNGAFVVLQSMISKLNNSNNNGKPISISDLIAAPNFHTLLDSISRILEAKKLSLNQQ